MVQYLHFRILKFPLNKSENMATHGKIIELKGDIVQQAMFDYHRVPPLSDKPSVADKNHDIPINSQRDPPKKTGTLW